MSYLIQTHTGIKKLLHLREWFLSPVFTQIWNERNYWVELKSQKKRAMNQPSCSRASPCYLLRMLLIPGRNGTSKGHTHISKNTEGNVKQIGGEHQQDFVSKLHLRSKGQFRFPALPVLRIKLKDATLLQGQIWKIYKSFVTIWPCKDLSQWGLWCWQKIILHLFPCHLSLAEEVQILVTSTLSSALSLLWRQSWEKRDEEKVMKK